jgi:hypothetical protein
MLLLSAILLPEIIAEGGWRAWTAAVTSFGVLCFFAGALRTLLRRRRSPAAPSPGINLRK